ncbi:MAG: hypothetical protein PHG53_09735 [Phycisphaerae bacterium]|nr:hypothetical protein [Phycisphaerae bacterium]
MAKEVNLIKKIVLDVDGKEIPLTPEQEQKLCMALLDLLGIKKEQDDSFKELLQKLREGGRSFDVVITASALLVILQSSPIK